MESPQVAIRPYSGPDDRQDQVCSLLNLFCCLPEENPPPQSLTVSRPQPVLGPLLRQLPRHPRSSPQVTGAAFFSWMRCPSSFALITLWRGSAACLPKRDYPRQPLMSSSTCCVNYAKIFRPNISLRYSTWQRPHSAISRPNPLPRFASSI